MKVQSGMKTDLIRRIPIFATLSETEFQSIEHIFLIRGYRKNQIIFMEAETGHYMYIVLSGKVKVTKSSSSGKENLLAIHQAGDFFGEMALLDGKTSPATVSAMEDCKVASVASSDFHNLLMRNEKVVRQIIQVLCARVRQAWADLQKLSYGSAEAKICAELLQLGRKYGVTDARGTIINLKFTHQEMAEMVGTARETVTRTLAALQRQGTIEIDGRRIILLRPDALRASD